MGKSIRKVLQTSPLSTIATKTIVNGTPLSTIDRSPMTKIAQPITIGNRQWKPLSPFQW